MPRYLGKVRGGATETFAIVTMKADSSGPESISLFTEPELRASYRKSTELTESEINARIERARQKLI